MIAPLILLAGAFTGCGNVVSFIGPPPGSPAFPPSFATAAAHCVGGVGTAAALSISSPNAPPLGCATAQGGTMGYLAFYPAAVATEFAYGQDQLPTPWVASDMSLTFYGAQTTGTVAFSIETACSSGGGQAENFGAPVTITTEVSSTANGMENTSPFVGVATNGVNGCAPGATMSYRIWRWSTDSLAGEAYLVGLTITRRTS